MDKKWIRNGLEMDYRLPPLDKVLSGVVKMEQNKLKRQKNWSEVN